MALTQVQGGMLAGSTNTTTTIQSNGTTAITIDTSQNVGIGTSSPTMTATNRVTVDINGTSSSVLAQSSGGTTRGYSYVDSTQMIYGSKTAIPLIFQTTETERMRITSAGTVLLGTTSTSSFDGGFRAVPTGSGNSMQVIISNTGGGLPFLLNRSDDGNIIDFRRAGTNVGAISVTTSSTSYNTSSDYRLKENIAPMTGALAKVAQLKPVTYTWKSTGKTSQGFIAHELQAVVPDCVTGVKDAVDEEGNPVHQGVDTSFLVATLTAAIQELNAKVEAQAAEIAALKAAK